MKFVTQFNPGEWWTSADGRTWKRLYGAPAQQLSEGLGQIEEAMEELIKDGEDIINLQLQLINPSARRSTKPTDRIMRHAKKFGKMGPITSKEIANFHDMLTKGRRGGLEEK